MAGLFPAFLPDLLPTGGKQESTQLDANIDDRPLWVSPSLRLGIWVLSGLCCGGGGGEDSTTKVRHET